MLLTPKNPYLPVFYVLFSMYWCSIKSHCIVAKLAAKSINATSFIRIPTLFQLKNVHPYRVKRKVICHYKYSPCQCSLYSRLESLENTLPSYNKLLRTRHLRTATFSSELGTALFKSWLDKSVI